jgi:hypothetical protein
VPATDRAAAHANARNNKNNNTIRTQGNVGAVASAVPTADATPAEEQMPHAAPDCTMAAQGTASPATTAVTEAPEVPPNAPRGEPEDSCTLSVLGRPVLPPAAAHVDLLPPDPDPALHSTEPPLPASASKSPASAANAISLLHAPGPDGAGIQHAQQLGAAILNMLASHQEAQQPTLLQHEPPPPPQPPIEMPPPLPLQQQQQPPSMPTSIQLALQSLRSQSTHGKLHNALITALTGRVQERLPRRPVPSEEEKAMALALRMPAAPVTLLARDIPGRELSQYTVLR